MTRSAPPAVDREPDEVEVQQLAELAGPLEPGLVAPVIRLGRAPDRGHELAARHDLVAHGRNVVLPTASAEEAQAVGAGCVAGQDLREVAAKLALGPESGRKLKRPCESVAVRDLFEELVDLFDPD